VSIPLIDKAHALLPEYKFKVLTNQKTNLHLKKIKALCKIETNISCHVARHTFATIGLNCGIPLEVVSEVLGHSSTRVTKIYAKMLDEFKINELKKWSN
jgi:integrase/recombinase XerC